MSIMIRETFKRAVEFYLPEKLEVTELPSLPETEEQRRDHIDDALAAAEETAKFVAIQETEHEGFKEETAHTTNNTDIFGVLKNKIAELEVARTNLTNDIENLLSRRAELAVNGTNLHMMLLGISAVLAEKISDEDQAESIVQFAKKTQDEATVDYHNWREADNAKYASTFDDTVDLAVRLQVGYEYESSIFAAPDEDSKLKAAEVELQDRERELQELKNQTNEVIAQKRYHKNHLTELEHNAKELDYLESIYLANQESIIEEMARLRRMLSSAISGGLRRKSSTELVLVEKSRD